MFGAGTRNGRFTLSSGHGPSCQGSSSCATCPGPSHRGAIGSSLTAKVLDAHVLQLGDGGGQANAPGPRELRTGDIKALPIRLTPNLVQAMNAPVPFEDATGLGLQDCVAPGAIRQPGRIGPLRQVIVAGGRAIGTLQIGLDHWVRTNGAVMAKSRALQADRRRTRPSFRPAVEQPRRTSMPPSSSAPLPAREG